MIEISDVRREDIEIPLWEPEDWKFFIEVDGKKEEIPCYFFVYTVMNREFDAKIRRVGNSYVVTILSNIVKRYKLIEGRFLTVNIEYGDDKD